MRRPDEGLTRPDARPRCKRFVNGPLATLRIDRTYRTLDYLVPRLDARPSGCRGTVWTPSNALQNRCNGVARRWVGSTPIRSRLFLNGDYRLDSSADGCRAAAAGHSASGLLTQLCGLLVGEVQAGARRRPARGGSRRPTDQQGQWLQQIVRRATPVRCGAGAR